MPGSATTRGAVALGIRCALALPAWIIAFSYLGVGSLARDAGHPLGAALLSTILIWAAPAQLVLFGMLSNGGLVPAIAVAVALSAIRLMPMTLALFPYLRRPGQGFPLSVATAHFIAATSWVDGMHRLPGLKPEERLPYFLAFGLTCMTLSTVTTGLGFLLVTALPPALGAGLVSLTPIYFSVTLAAGCRRMADWVAVLSGLGLAPLAQAIVGSDFDLLVAGLFGGTVAYWVARRASLAAA